MVDTMRAERSFADSKTVAVEDVPIPEPGPGEVLVKVAYCGICHSDLSLINRTFPAQRPVVTQGHEAAGSTSPRAGRARRVRTADALGATDPNLRDNIAEITGGGGLVGVGMSAETPSIGSTSMFGLIQKQVLGHLGYQNVDIETLATLVSLGRLDLSRWISEIVSLEDVRDGIEMLERQDGNPIRILVKP
ncbi:alcohol dehydrogenase catalytic domain-containing protein [Mycobacterium sp. ACS1612]|uniref:alcohol dehydrogenase catalytic domain-containing protein n=1 Tax=Mycobacterium sp. ACS1612 TaxID=1834117 RepID=UPI000A7AAC12